MPMYRSSKISIRERMGSKKILRGLVCSHFEDLKDMVPSTDYFVVCTPFVDPNQKSRAKVVDTDLCLSGRKGWKPKVGETFDCEKAGQALIVHPAGTL